MCKQPETSSCLDIIWDGDDVKITDNTGQFGWTKCRGDDCPRVKVLGKEIDNLLQKIQRLEWENTDLLLRAQNAEAMYRMELGK